MRLCVLTPFFYPHTGGSEEYSLKLHAYLKQLDPSINIDIICYNTDQAPETETYQQLFIYRIPSVTLLPDQFVLPNYFSLIKLLRQLKQRHVYDVVISQTRFFDNSWWAPLVAKYFKARSILIDHCAGYPRHANLVVNALSRLFDHLIFPLVARCYDLVIGSSQAVINWHQQLGVGDTQLIYGGVDTQFFYPVKKATGRTIPNLNQEFRPDDIIISFAGRMIKSKGPQFLAEAAQKLRQSNQNLYFIFAGIGPLNLELSKYQNKGIFFLGNLNKAQIRELFQATDIVVQPSSHPEGISNTLLEAGAMARAVITTASGGTLELIEADKTGLIIQPTVFDVEQAIEKLVKNAKLRNSLGQNLRQTVVQNFDWQMIAKRYLELFSGLVRRSPPRAGGGGGGGI